MIIWLDLLLYNTFIFLSADSIINAVVSADRVEYIVLDPDNL